MTPSSFVYRKLVDGHPIYKAEPMLDAGATTTDFRLAETRGADQGWPAGPEWAGFEPVSILIESKRGKPGRRGQGRGRKQ